MTEKKNQHFVPKMYLKLFANADRRSIGVFNLKRGCFIPVGSISDQASKNWFYDRDGQIENVLGIFETRAAALIAQILAADRLPPRYGPDLYHLLTFIALQRERTEAAVSELNERTDRYMKAVLRHDPRSQHLVDALDSVIISRNDAVAESLFLAHVGTPLLLDLACKLIVNTSGCAFFISDAPIILHNPLFEGSGAPATGYANVGLQVIVPLGPWRALLFYDDVAYRVGNGASNTVRLVNPAHAALINDLQWESAEHNLYVSPATPPDLLHSAHERWCLRRPSRRIVLHDMVLRDDSQQKRVRIGVGRAPSTVRLNLPFVKTRLDPPGVWDQASEPPVRDPEWAHYVTTLADMLGDEQITYKEFVRRTFMAPRSRGYRRRNR